MRVTTACPTGPERECNLPLPPTGYIQAHASTAPLLAPTSAVGGGGLLGNGKERGKAHPFLLARARVTEDHGRKSGSEAVHDVLGSPAPDAALLQPHTERSHRCQPV